jgi:hypothetical protein
MADLKDPNDRFGRDVPRGAKKGFGLSGPFGKPGMKKTPIMERVTPKKPTPVMPGDKVVPKPGSGKMPMPMPKPVKPGSGTMKKPMPLPKPVKPGSGTMKKPMPMPKKDVPEYSKAVPVNRKSEYNKEQLQSMAKEAYKKITKKG